MGDYADEGRKHKIRRTAPPFNDWESISTAPEKPRKKFARPWKIEYRIQSRELQRRFAWSHFWGLWSKQRRWGNWSAYKTRNARDQALASMQRRDETYWQYRGKDPT